MRAQPVFAVCFACLGLAFACAKSVDRAEFETPDAATTEPPPAPTPSGLAPQPDAACADPSCRIPTCAGGATTVLEGDVFDPAGKTKLYNALVYVPSTDLAPLTTGATCERCVPPSGAPYASALTDEQGHFRLEGVPAGKRVPLVVQVGKWRRRIELPEVAPCQTTQLADGVARLPRNHVEGDLPQVAVVTGRFDELACFLARIGVDGNEYGPPDKGGRIHLYRGIDGPDYVNGGAPPATDLWNDAARLAKYDAVFLGCEGAEYDTDEAGRNNKSPQAKLAMRVYANGGGRVFAMHYQEAWFKNNPEPDFRGVASWNPVEPDGEAIGERTLDVDTTFPKGAAFAKWLVNVGASIDEGKLDAKNIARNLASINPALAQRWLYQTDPSSVVYMSFNAPVGAPAGQECGRAVLSDVHLGDEPSGVQNIPQQCGTKRLSGPELALEFLLFDLFACVQPDTTKPAVPH